MTVTDKSKDFFLKKINLKLHFISQNI